MKDEDMGVLFLFLVHAVSLLDNSQLYEISLHSTLIFFFLHRQNPFQFYSLFSQTESGSCSIEVPWSYP